MAYTFMKAEGREVGRSLVEDDKLELARQLLTEAKSKGLTFLLPVDEIVADKIDASSPASTIDASRSIPAGKMGLDIGPKTRELYATQIAKAKTILWNGPMGVFEVAPFAAGTVAIAQAIAKNRGASSIVGGGDSVAAVHQAGVANKITHISTGGGASLEFLEGKKLPGVEALTDK
jgi:phosphoglycerate kinase